MSTSSKRILFVTQTHNVWGGMEQWLHHFSAWLGGRGWDVAAVLPRGERFNDPDAYLREHRHLRATILDVRGSSDRTRILRLADAIRRQDAGVVIPIASGAVFDAMALARRAGARARLIVPVRSLHPELFCNVRDRFATVDHAVGVSRLIEEVLRRLLPGEPVRVHYVRHGARPASAGRQRREGGAIRVGFVGRLEEQTKRISDIPLLLRELDRLGTAAELHVWGSGPDASMLGSLQGRVPIFLHGAAPQVSLASEAYPSMDVIVLFSPAEGSPNAIYEAMHHGVVPVISRYRGQRAEGFVRDGETGFTFEIGDAGAAAGAIDRLWRDGELLSATSEAVRASVREETDERMHRDWERILDAALAIPARPPLAHVSLPPPSAVERLLPASAADLLRHLGRRAPRQPHGWGEWPGNAPASAACVETVIRLIEEIDRSPGTPASHPLSWRVSHGEE